MTLAPSASQKIQRLFCLTFLACMFNYQQVDSGWKTTIVVKCCSVGYPKQGAVHDFLTSVRNLQEALIPFN